MPFLDDQVWEVPTGTLSNIILTGVQNAGLYLYTYRTTTPGFRWPAGFMQGTGPTDTDVIRNGQSSTAGRFAVHWEAVARDGPAGLDPDTVPASTPAGSAPPSYQAWVFINFVGAPPPPASLTDALNRLNFRDVDKYRVGVQHSDPRTRYLFMSLPFWAQTNYAPSLDFGGPERRQFLPIENIQELILPQIRSNELEVALFDENQGSFIGENFVPIGARPNARPSNLRTPGQGVAGRRSKAVYGRCSLRLLWREEFASHGGPYGLRNASLDVSRYPFFAYYQRDFGDDDREPQHRRGKVLLSWRGYVDGFTETVTRRGIVVDVSIRPNQGLNVDTYPTGTIPSGGLQYMPSLDWSPVVPGEGM